MRAGAKQLLAGAGVFLLVTLGVISFGVADPGGWHPLRVALAAWPLGAVLGALASTYPFDDDDAL